jgi:L-rhamnose mutarotase
MQRVAFLLSLKSDDPAVRSAYLARHDAIWPEMSALLTEAGMRNYSIFRLGTQLFAYCEVDDWAVTLRRLNDSEVNARWQVHMADILDTPIDPATGSLFVLEEMFHHEG